MSERGSFVTEYMSCDRCALAVRTVLFGAASDRWLVPFEHSVYPIIAGKLGEGWATGEVTIIEGLREKIERRICHPVRIAVLCEDSGGDAVLRFEPRR